MARAALSAATATAACALVILRIGWTPALPADCCLATAAAPLAVTDLTEHRLPNRITYPSIAAIMILLSVAAWQHHQPQALLRAIAAAAVSVCFFLIIALVTDGLGAGDIKLAALSGLPLGWAGWNHLALATVTGLTLAALYAAALLLTHQAGPRDQIPLGPFLLTGALLGIVI
jgi:leader peptidase (prepilin peptidase)/N-methyltransferase